MKTETQCFESCPIVIMTVDFNKELEDLTEQELDALDGVTMPPCDCRELVQMFQLALKTKVGNRAAMAMSALDMMDEGLI